jgi:hypothetical protein
MRYGRAIALSAGLALAAASTAAAQQQEQHAPHQFRATMTGNAEVPGPGDPDGGGTAMVTVDPSKNQVCYEITTTNLSQATAAHIHRGQAGAAGPPAVTLQAPTGGHAQGCQQVDEDVAEDIIEHPDQFYVNVHTTEHAGGAIRGQLAPVSGMMHDMGGMMHDTTMHHDTMAHHDTTGRSH